MELRSFKIGRDLARKARFEAPTSLASILWFSSAAAVSMGKLQNLSLPKDSKEVVMSFCVAGVALCDIQTCFVTCQKSFCVAGAALLRELHFSWQAQDFGYLHRHFAWQAQQFRRVELRVLCESNCPGCVQW